LSFDAAVTNYFKNKSSENQILVTDYLKKWVNVDAKLIELSSNAPLIQPLLPLSKSLSDLSQQLLLKIEKKQTVNPIH